MRNSLELEQYLREGMTVLVRDIIKATVSNPIESRYFAKYSRAVKKAGRRRQRYQKIGEHIPSFLIASITGNCNLACAGCYDRANHICAGHEEMSRKEWGRIFTEAENLGITAILLAGGEPMMRIDILEEAAKHPAIMFPVFTNGTMIGEKAMGLLTANRNVVPIISIEGRESQTDMRRGRGTYQKTVIAMQDFMKEKLLFGTSVTVTNDNLDIVTGDDFIFDLKSKGCKAIIYVEYVPVEKPELALDDATRGLLAERITALRKSHTIIILSFPGDEAEAGGCLAAGRGFFHINAQGGAEPCPFSPYSDTSLKTVSLREALKSPLFTQLRNSGTLEKEHIGGCTLFSQEEYIKSLIYKAD